MKKKLIIFDLDGTLLDTVNDLKEAVNFSLEKNGETTKTLEHVTKSIGNGVELLIARCLENGFSNPKYQVIFNDFRQYYLSHSDVFTKAYPNVKETIFSLKKLGYFIAVCTNKLHEAAYEMIHKYFGDIFDYILGSKKELNKKPHPDMINDVISNFEGISKQDVLYIGDTDVDVLSAKNANVDYVLVSYGYRNKKALLSYDPSAKIIDDISELIDLLEH